MGFSIKENLDNNIQAIRTLLQIEKENREATAAEKHVLKKYVGFGGIKEIALDETNIDSWSNSSLKYLDQIKEFKQLLKDNHTDDEYKDILDSLKASILDAFYTPTEIANTISKSLENLNVKNILETSAGTGRFIDACQSTFNDTNITAYELDNLTGRLLKSIHPSQTIVNSGLESMKNRNGYFDLAISNIPFGNYRVHDSELFHSKDSAEKNSQNNIMDYFFCKSLLSCRESGVIALITSSAFSDNAAHAPIREYLVNNSNLISAIRLPNNTFEDDANTSVQTDLLIFQKDTLKKGLSPLEKNWSKHNERKGISYNAVFTDANRLIYTSGSRKTDQYGNPYNYIEHSGGIQGIATSLEEKLKNDIALNLKPLIQTQINKAKSIEVLQPKKKTTKKKKVAAPMMDDLFSSFFQATNDVPVTAQVELVNPIERLKLDQLGDTIKIGSNNRLLDVDSYFKYNDRLAQIKSYSNQEVELEYQDNHSHKAIIEDYIDIRNNYYRLYELEKETENTYNDIRKELNRVYDTFVSKHGFINKALDKNIISEIYLRDVQLLENAAKNSFIKSDLFVKNIFEKNIENLSVREAFVASLNEVGKFDIDLISKYTGIEDEAYIYSELEDSILFNPETEQVEIKEVALFGNIYERISNLADYIRDNPNNQFAKKSLDEYRKNIPAKVPFELLDFNLGERWIPTEIFEAFSEHVLGTPLNITYVEDSEVVGRNDDWIVSTSSPLPSDIQELYAVYNEDKVRSVSSARMFYYAMTDTVPDITKIKKDEFGNPETNEKGEQIRVKDGVAIRKALIHIENIRKRFEQYMIEELPFAKKEQIEGLYNYKFNACPKIEYDGSHLQLKDLDFKGLGIEDIRPSQRSAIWQNLVLQGGINDHEVGLGKTLTMCITAHEGGKMGLWKKPLIVGMKANIQDIADTYQKAYPNDKVLFLSKFEKKDLEEILNNIKHNDYDAIILTKEGLARIPLDDKILKTTLREELKELNAAYDFSYTMDKAVAKRLEVNIKNLNSELQALQEKQKNKFLNVPTFGELGIGHILVDEVHNFKNLKFATRHAGVPGIGNPTGSQQASGLLNYVRCLQDKAGKDLQATFCSGTVISNSLSELYVWFKYLSPRQLKKQNLSSFDAWVSVFARKSVDYEINVTNDIVLKPRFRSFIKLPELAMNYKRITNHKLVANEPDIKRPTIKEKLVAVEPNSLQLAYNDALKEYAITGDASVIGKERTAGRETGKMLVVTSEAGKSAVDARLVFPDEPIDGDCKINACVREACRIYESTTDVKGIQLIFSDIGTPDKKKDFTIYDEMRNQLIANGVPAKEIAFIHEHDSTDEKKKALFDRVNKGEIRFLVGSTDKLGTGTNVQKLCAAIHHLDITWKPSIHEQRNGRGFRQNNQFESLEVIYYATKQSLDHYKFSLNKDKKMFIDQIKQTNTSIRTANEGASEGMNFEEYLLNIEDGSRKKVLELRTLEKQIQSLQEERTYFETHKRENTNPSHIERLEKSIINITEGKKQIDADMLSVSSLNTDSKFYQALDLPSFRKFTAEDFETHADFTTIKEDTLKELGKYLKEEIDECKELNTTSKNLGKLGQFDIVVDVQRSLSIETNLPFSDCTLNLKSNQTGLKYSHNNGYLPILPRAAGTYLGHALKGLIDGRLEQNVNKTLELKQAELKQCNNLKNTTWIKTDLLSSTITKYETLYKEVETLKEQKATEKKVTEKVEAPTQETSKRKGMKL